jgi:signal transduction histidine kinase
MTDTAWPPHDVVITNKGSLRRQLARLAAYVWPAGKHLIETERDNFRLRQLIEQAPQAYALWSENGSYLISPLLCRWLDKGVITTIQDVMDGLGTDDVRAFESLWQRLERDGQPFSLRARTANDKRVLGIQAERRGDADDMKHYLLWFTDLTTMNSAVTQAQQEKNDLQQHLTEFKQRLDGVPLPLWLRDSEARLQWCNQAYADMIETNAANAIEQQTELMGTKSSIAKTIAHRARMDRSTISEKHPLIVSGERRLIQISETPIGDDNQTLGVAQDITALDDMQSELRRFRASTQELLRALNTGIAIFNPKTQLTFYNDAFLGLFPLEEAFLDDKPTLGEIMEILREKRRLPEQADFKLYKKQWLDRFTSLIAPYEELMHMPDGSTVRVLVVPHPLGGLFMTFEDVTSRLELESSYNTLIAVQRETIDNLAEGLAVWKSNARLALFNPSFAAMWGFAPKDLEGNPHAARLIPNLEQFFASEQWVEVKELLQQAAINRQAMHGRLNLSDGREIDYATIPLPDGGILNRFTDVSDTRKVERALREKNAALEQAERLKLDFLANVSYQLRTPLNAMMGFAEVLEKQYFGPLNERQIEYANGMMQAGDKLIGLVNDILDLSTIEAGLIALQIRPLAIHGMMKSLYDLTHEWARKQHITMKLQCDTNIGTLDADERRIKQALLNLISNSIKFTPEQGQIDIIVTRHDPMLHIQINDTGIGISKEDQEKIFSPFVQLQKTQRHAGAGLGLSLVKSIVELHGGQITLDSDTNKGTRITCKLPLRQTTDKK